MTDTIRKRSREIAVYITETGATVRNAAKKFNVSKSTVHKDCQRLKAVDATLYEAVRLILEENKRQRHIRGGMATRRKYKGI